MWEAVTMLFCFLAPNLDNADSLCDRNLVTTPDFYLHQVEVTDQDPTSGSLKADV